MITFPNCKINLGLFVTGKRPDGYHNIESIMVPVPFYDVLEIIPQNGGDTEIIITGLDLPGDVTSNLCFRAYQLIKSGFDIPPVQIHLHKVIPPGSGLGGGSSDGAFVLKMLNDLFGFGLTTRQLEDYAGKLGSDCPFFIKNLPAFAHGKGNLLQTIDSRLSGYYLVLVIPEMAVNTAQAYAFITPAKKNISLLDLYNGQKTDWKNLLVNDFEIHVFSIFPKIARIKEKLYSAGAFYSSMSGSGSAVYGVFENEVDLGNSFPKCKIWQGRI